MTDGGEIVDAQPSRRLVIRWQHHQSPTSRPKARRVLQEPFPMESAHRRRPALT